jgi:hypothetical protein
MRGSNVSAASHNNNSLERMSRVKKPVNYNNMVQGIGEISASMDYGEVSGVNNARHSKKNAPANPKDTKQRCEQMFQLLSCHPSVDLFMQTLDPNHPKFAELSKDFINLNSIQLNFRQGKYQSTFQLGLDIRKMWTNAFKLFSDDPAKYSKTQDIQQYFEKVFVELDNKPLV